MQINSSDVTKSIRKHSKLSATAIKTPPPRLEERSHRNTEYCRSVKNNSAFCTDSLSHVSVSTIISAAVVSAAEDKSSRLRTALRILVKRIDMFLLACARALPSVISYAPDEEGPALSPRRWKEAREFDNSETVSLTGQYL